VSARHPYLERLGVAAMAHRGGALETVENTRTAFTHAVDLGYRYIESDVQVTRDGVPVLFHDDRLDRVTDATGLISERSWHDLRHVQTEAGPDQIMRMVDALEEFGRQRFNLDLKSDGAVEPFLAVLSATKVHERVLVGSFSDDRLRTVRRRVGPTLATSAGPREVARAVAASKGWALPRNFSPLALQVPLKFNGIPVVTKSLVSTAHNSGVEVHVWTIDDAETMTGLLDLGVDAILTDRPTLLREVLTARNQWTPFV